MPWLRRIDLSRLGEPAPEAARVAREVARRAFDLGRAPLARLVLVELGGVRHLLWTLHHTICDGVSVGIFARELAALYRGETLALLPVSYVDWARWQRRWLVGEALEAQVAFWRRELAGLEATAELPSDRPRPPVRRHRGNQVALRLDAELTGRLRALGGDAGATLFMVLVAAFDVLVTRLSGHADVALGVPVAGRRSSEVEGLIGLFLNTLVLRADTSGDPTFAALLEQVRSCAARAFSHQDVPFEKLLAELAPARNPSRTPFFQVLFNMLDVEAVDLGVLDVPGVRIEALAGADAPAKDSPAKFDLTVYATREGEGLRLLLVYDADLFEAARMDDLGRQYELVLAGVAERPTDRIGTYSLLTPAAAAMLPDPAESLAAGRAGAVHELFLEQARRRPEAVAVVDPASHRTYGNLSRSSGEVAERLIDEGVRRGDVVAVCAHRSAGLVDSLLGVLRAGAAFVVLDPAHPPARSAEIVRLVRPRVELGGKRGIEIPRYPVPSLRDEEPARCRRSQRVAPSDVAAITFTSGSTGEPKGVVQCHGPLASFPRWEAEQFGLGSQERFSLLSGLAHDPLQRDLFTSLCLGASLVVPDPEQLLEPGYLASWAHENRVSVTHLTPAMADLLTRDKSDPSEPSDLPALRLAVVGGDVLRPVAAQRLAAFAPWARIVNLYGSTETHRALAWHEIPRHEISRCGTGNAALPLGHGLPGVQLLVANAAGNLAGVGELGEILVRSPHLARGYLDDEELTRTRFRPNPFAGDASDRVCATGDLGRYLPDGTVAFAGRADRQVQIRGFRVDPAEVEAWLARVAGVEQAAVVVREAPQGDLELVAFTMPALTVPGSDVRAFLAERLPAYMVPSRFLALDELPLTPNGKVDRGELLLRAGEAGTPLPESTEAPASPEEEVLAAIWAEVLGVEGTAATRSIGRGDDFFALGGHSLLATRVVARARDAFGVEPAIRDLFEQPTLAGFARCLAEARHRGEPSPRPRPSSSGPPPLSFAQRRLWFLDQLEPGRPVYNMPGAVRLSGELDAGALEEALRGVVQRHEVLRTTFEAFAGEPRQVVARGDGVWLPRIDLSALPEPRRATELRRVVEAQALRPFELARGPLVRGFLLAEARRRHVLLLVVHHIVADGGSLALLVRELAALYAGRGPLPPLPLQYGDYALWQSEVLQGEALEARLGWWHERLAGDPPVPELPADRPRPAAPSFRGSVRFLRLPKGRGEELRNSAGHARATLFMVLLAAFDALIHRLTGETDLVVGTAVAGRTHRELEGLIGLFVNVLALRVDAAGDPSLGELLGRVRRETLGAYAHQDVPFERIVEAISPERDLGRQPLISVVLSFQSFPDPAPAELPGLELEPMTFDPGTAKVDLTLQLTESRGSVAGRAEYAAELFDATTVERYLAAWRRVLAAWPRQGEDGPRLSQVPLLGRAERHQLDIEWNESPEIATQAATVLDLVASQVQTRPAATALVADAAVHLSYGELAHRSDQLAGYLHRRYGVGLESRVGIALDRRPERVVAILGVMKVGASWVPLDPGYPAERLAFMTVDADLEAVVTSLELPVPAGSARVLLWERDSAAIAEEPPTRQHSPAPDNLAYVIYTSGSTGRPKGVMVPHRGLCSFITFLVRLCGLGPGHRVLQFASFSFDAAVAEVFMALASGATLRLAAGERLLPGPGLVELLRCDRVSLAVLPPSSLSALGDDAPQRLTDLGTLIVAGEACAPELVARWTDRAGAVRRFLNGYGPTETTIATSMSLFPKARTWPRPPIGRPVAGLAAHILDRRLNPRPLGVAGELCAAGVGLVRGYLVRGALTAERFVPDRFSRSPGRRLYRTGDLVRWLAVGELDFLGRVDDQVKVRGIRIELGEVEARLAEAPGVEQAVVVHDGAAGLGAVGLGGRLVAWIRPRRGASLASPPVAPAIWREHLRSRLPEAMVPALFVAIDDFPRTPSGKLDRAALLRLEPAAGGGARQPSRVRTAVEDVLAAIWEEVLGAEHGPFGPDDDFFELGGHSLVATRVASRIREVFGVDFALRRVFERPTLAELAAGVEQARHEGVVPEPPLVARPPGTAVPLSFAQQRLWFLDRLLPGIPLYHVPLAARLTGRLDAAALEAALSAVVARHEVLRTTLPDEAGRPRQVIAPASALTLPVVDLSGLRRAPRHAERRRRTAGHVRRPFDLAAGPLLRAVLLREAGDEHVFCLAVHHAVTDGESMGVLLRELTAFYHGTELPPLPVQYGDYALWQRSRFEAVAERELAWWRRRLDDAPEIVELPLDRPRRRRPSRRGARRTTVSPAALAGGLRRFSRRWGTTLFMTLLAAFQALLVRLTHQRDLVVGTVTTGRGRRELEGLIGFFVNTLPLRLTVSGDPSFEEVASGARETALASFAHQDVPFEKLVEELAPGRDLGRQPLIQVMLILQNLPEEPATVEGLGLQPLKEDTAVARFDLSVEVREREHDLVTSFEYATELFDATSVARLAASLRALLEKAVASPGSRLSELPVLTAPGSHQLVVEWNDTADPRPAQTFLEVFARRVARSADAVALSGGDESGGYERLTYRELDRCAGRLAKDLVRRGAGPEGVVGIALERAPRLVVAALAVWKAGAAWLPLDPAYPRERLAFMIDDTRVALVITEAAYAAALPVEEKRRFLWEHFAAAPSPAESPRATLVASNLAYVVYTSGSTGRPKGVMVSHRGLPDFVHALIRLFGLGPGNRFLQFASFSFDAAVAEIFPALAAGATLRLAPRARLTPGPGLVELLDREALTTALLPPSSLAVLGEAAARRLPALETLIVAGEACPEELVRRWAHGRRFLNGYGPTETTVAISFGVAKRGDGKLSLGRPLPNLRAWLTDRHLVPVPIGVTGEVCAAGGALARGYLGRPGHSAERFIPDPFATRGGGRLYRTGDLARSRPDGELEFLGRIDDQVKIRGFRVELGEVEARLAELPEVEQAVAVTGGAGRLRAFVRPIGDASLDTARLVEALRRHLPEHMVPASITVVEDLPRTPSGKVDRQTLAACSKEGRKGNPALPRDLLELTLVRLFEDVLETSPVGLDDDFFELGGHSLLAVGLLNRVAESCGRVLPPAVLFEAPSAARLAAELRRGGEGLTPASPLVELAGGASETSPPLVCVHPAGGDVLCYSGLARALGRERPVYGLRASGLAGETEPLHTVEAMAEQYLDALDRSGRSSGPLVLAGWSFGGLVAWEMAGRLCERGGGVALVVLFDTFAQVGDEAPSDEDAILDHFLKEHLSEDAPQMAGGSRQSRLARMVEHAREAGTLPPGFNLEQAQGLLRVFSACGEAARAYRPRYWDGQVLLFRAEVDDGAPLRHDPSLGWSALAPELVVRNVPDGSHRDLMKSPYVESIASSLSDFLRGPARQP